MVRWVGYRGEKHLHGERSTRTNEVSRMLRGGDIGRWERHTGQSIHAGQDVCAQVRPDGPNKVSRICGTGDIASGQDTQVRVYVQGKMCVCR